MSLTRRTLLGSIAALAALGRAGSVLALSVDAAKAHVDATVQEVLTILRAANGKPVDPDALREVIARRANLPLIAKFCAGRSWREMSEEQQARYIDAFSHYISVTYARRFNDYSGQPNISVISAMTKARNVPLDFHTPFVGRR